MAEAVERKQIGLLGLSIKDSKLFVPRFERAEFEVVSWDGIVENIDEFMGKLRHCVSEDNFRPERRHIITNGNWDFGVNLASILEAGDVVAYSSIPVDGRRYGVCLNQELDLLKYRVKMLDFSVMTRPNRNSRSGLQVVVGGSMEGYLSMIDAFKAIAGPKGSYQLMSQKVGAGHATKELFELYRRGEIAIDEIGRAVDYLVKHYNIYPPVMERLVEENVFSY